MALEAPLLSVKEAADFLIKSPSREYRVRCLALWREIHGDNYADSVKRLVVHHFEVKKNGKKMAD